MSVIEVAASRSSRRSRTSSRSGRSKGAARCGRVSAGSTSRAHQLPILKPFPSERERVAAPLRTRPRERGIGMGSQAEVDAAAVAHGAPELLGVIDRDARLVWCNRRWYEFAGRDGSQLLGDLWLADLHGEDLPLLRTLLQHAEPFVLDVRMRRHDGRERSMAMRGTPHEGDATIVSLVDTEGRRIAEALQHSMLPDAMPDIPGVSLHARCLPGGNEDIGGDWYDVVPLQGARYGVVIGDVAGHGVRAATVMGQLRHALRAFAADGVD